MTPSNKIKVKFNRNDIDNCGNYHSKNCLLATHFNNKGIDADVIGSRVTINKIRYRIPEDVANQLSSNQYPHFENLEFELTKI